MFILSTAKYSSGPTNLTSRNILSKPILIRSMIRHVKSSQNLAIFPEGRMTVTGGLMKIYEGTGFIADKAKATVVPVLIDGTQYTRFSRLKGIVRLRWFPKVTLTVF